VGVPAGSTPRRSFPIIEIVTYCGWVSTARNTLLRSAVSSTRRSSVCSPLTAAWSRETVADGATHWRRDCTCLLYQNDDVSKQEFQFQAIESPIAMYRIPPALRFATPWPIFAKRGWPTGEVYPDVPLTMPSSLAPVKRHPGGSLGSSR
jgi:hypothetical protein